MNGFTLLEISLVLIIITIIFMSIFLLILNVTNFNFYYFTETTTEGKTLLTLKILEKELKSMEVSNIGSYPLEEASATKIVFYSNIDNDDLVEKLTYFLNGDKLEKTLIRPTGSPLVYDPAYSQTNVVLTNLINPQTIFSFYDDNLQETNDIAKIELIKVNLKVNKGKEVFESFIFVAPRNLK